MMPRIYKPSSHIDTATCKPSFLWGYRRSLPPDVTCHGTVLRCRVILHFVTVFMVSSSWACTRYVQGLCCAVQCILPRAGWVTSM